MTHTRKILVAKILTAHGVKGFVKLRCFLEDPRDVADYNSITDDSGRAYKITLKNPIKGDWVAAIDGITDRTAAEKLRGRELFITRDQLPDLADGELYLDDLIGLKALNPENIIIGEIIAIQNFGASDLLEIMPLQGGKSFYVPMAEPYFGTIDFQQGTVEIADYEAFMS
ncbi:MAG: 16S rRNA processing protein RimM [Alphaproteobacteria bacterium]|nr:16S rRNA processing protein RimM [Alphaproteobacteria bacterium]